MHGNVWEWCRDWRAMYPSTKEIDPGGPGAGSYRVIRGGSWNDPARRCRSAYRCYLSPDLCRNDLGFRIMLPLRK